MARVARRRGGAGAATEAATMAIYNFNDRDAHGVLQRHTSLQAAGLLREVQDMGAYDVAGAGESDINGLYKYAGYRHNGEPVYKCVGSHNTYYLFYQLLEGVQQYLWVIDTVVHDRPGGETNAIYHNETLVGQWTGGGTPQPTVTPAVEE